MDFGELHDRLVAALRTRLRNGELSERRLAHLTGISQPHVHNVLKGVRILSPSAADQILKRLNLSLLDLVAEDQKAHTVCTTCHHQNRSVEVPVLEGLLGPGLPLPRTPSKVEVFPFPRSYVATAQNAVVARLGPDLSMSGLLDENDLVLLDQSPLARSDLTDGAFYAVNRYGEGLIRRVRRDGNDLLLAAGFGTAEVFCLESIDVLDVIAAKVRWIGRRLWHG